MHDFVLKQNISGSHFIDIFFISLSPAATTTGPTCMLPSLHMYGNSD